MTPGTRCKVRLNTPHTPGRFALASTPLGWMALAASEQGIRMLAFADTAEEAEAAVHQDGNDNAFVRDDTSLAAWVERIIAFLSGQQHAIDEIPLDIQNGTPFQRRVWELLRAIPCGQTRTYADLARKLGQPTATRAIARACAANPIAVLVPCHRVVRSDGGLGGYRWGIERKRALLALEQQYATLR